MKQLKKHIKIKENYIPDINMSYDKRHVIIKCKLKIDDKTYSSIKPVRLIEE